MSRVAALRQAFDAAFAAPPPAAPDPAEDFLAVRIADDLGALRVRDVAHLSVDHRIVPLPSSRAELLGLAGIRGVLVPVLSLARVLGHGAPGGAPRWLVTCGAGFEVAFAFDEFQGHRRIPAADVRRVDAAEAPRPHVRELFRDGPLVRAVVDLPSVVRALTAPGAHVARDTRRPGQAGAPLDTPTGPQED